MDYIRKKKKFMPTRFFCGHVMFKTAIETDVPHDIPSVILELWFKN